MGVEYGFCKCAGFEQGKTEDYRIGCKGKNRAVQVVGYYHFIDKDSVNANAYHNQKPLKAEGKKPFEIVVSNLSPFPVCHGCEWNRRNRAIQ